MQLEQALEEVRKILFDSLKLIVLELDNAKSNKVIIMQGNINKYIRNGFYSPNSLSGNDFRDYFWLIVKVGNNKYCLSVIYDDINNDSGNFRRQIGKIQFSKIISDDENKIGTANFKDENGNWIFCADNYYNPNIDVDSPNCAVNTANAFLDYLEECGENDVRQPIYRNKEKYDDSL
jgi:hypothetical protein